MKKFVKLSMVVFVCSTLYGSADIEPHLSAMKHEKPSLWYWNKKFIFALSKNYEKYFQYKSILTKEIK